MEEKPKIIIITATYERPGRNKYLGRHIKTFRKLKNILWIIVEDDNKKNEKVKNMLDLSGLEYLYLNIGPTRDNGNTQKDAAFRYIRDAKIEGVVYVCDDDNFCKSRLFAEIRKTKKISVFPVSNLGPHGIERPIVKNGVIAGWDAYWKERKFPLDWAGFAFDSRLLFGRKGIILKGFNWVDAVREGVVDANMEKSARLAFLRTHKNGETEFIENLGVSIDELEPLCDNCTKCYVWYNEPLHRVLAFHVVLTKIKSFCKKIKECYLKKQ